MKIDLIGMIFNTAGSRHFDGLIIDDDGKQLDAVNSLDHMILEYAKVRSGGTSDTVAVPSVLKDAPPAKDKAHGLLREALAWIENSQEPAPSLCGDIRKALGMTANRDS